MLPQGLPPVLLPSQRAGAHSG
eukprot:COSAG01_NODE_70485_length_258_cov_0.968553_2_plen_21_part_01